MKKKKNLYTILPRNVTVINSFYWQSAPSNMFSCSFRSGQSAEVCNVFSQYTLLGWAGEGNTYKNVCKTNCKKCNVIS